MNNATVRFQLDTRSDIAIIDEQTWKRIAKPYLRKTDKVAKRNIGQ